MLDCSTPTRQCWLRCAAAIEPPGACAAPITVALSRHLTCGLRCRRPQAMSAACGRGLALCENRMPRHAELCVSAHRCWRHVDLATAVPFCDLPVRGIFPGQSVSIPVRPRVLSANTSVCIRCLSFLSIRRAGAKKSPWICQVWRLNMLQCSKNEVCISLLHRNS